LEIITAVPDAEPLPDGHPHHVLHASDRQKLENGFLAEDTVEPDLDGNAPEPLPEIFD
jgi:hypothetical protein